jgi:2-oxo-4-hydroxy-4-carboxy-5-ureidoimidazoline decarboxylase
MSRKEQSGVAQSAEVQDRLRSGNQAYEEKFDRVFLIRAAGRSAEEILSQLEKRLRNSPDEEIAVVAGQLREIAILRLEGVIEA